MNFRKLLSSVTNDEVVIPVIRSALFDPNFSSFTVKVRGFHARPPDGWFHPSTHPLWPAPMLWLYIAHNEMLAPEPFDPHGTMAVTQGHFWHSFIEHVGKLAGLFNVAAPCSCGCKSEVERAFRDEVTGARGHVDGLLPEEIFEFKTMNSMKLRRIENGSPGTPEVLASYKSLCPEYYAQAQEYMRISGYRRHRSLLLAMEYPYPMREVVMDYDYGFAAQIAEKYLAVRQAVADQRMPKCPCSMTDRRACPARVVCV